MKYVTLGLAPIMSAAALFIGAAAVGQKPPAQPTCREATRQCLITAVTSYLDAILHGDGSRALLAPNVRRTLNGRVTEGADAIREKLNHEPAMLNRRNTRFFVNEAEHWVIAYFMLGLNNPEPTTTHIAERFKVENGLITEIEGIFFNEQGNNEGSSGWPD